MMSLAVAKELDFTELALLTNKAFVSEVKQSIERQTSGPCPNEVINIAVEKSDGYVTIMINLNNHYLSFYYNRKTHEFTKNHISHGEYHMIKSLIERW